MKKYLITGVIISFMFMQTGCAVYKFQTSKKLYGGGYVVKRNVRIIPEYTINRDNQAPADLELAKTRFNRRKSVVKHYYKKMGYIDSLWHVYFLDYFKFFGNVIFGVLKFPFVARSYIRYEKDPEYKQRIDKLEAEEEQREEARIKAWQDRLNEYIIKDLAEEEATLESGASIK